MTRTRTFLSCHWMLLSLRKKIGNRQKFDRRTFFTVLPDKIFRVKLPGGWRTRDWKSFRLGLNLRQPYIPFKLIFPIPFIICVYNSPNLILLGGCTPWALTPRCAFMQAFKLVIHTLDLGGVSVQWDKCFYMSASIWVLIFRFSLYILYSVGGVVLCEYEQ
jgi:hypothetical protein